MPNGPHRKDARDICRSAMTLIEVLIATALLAIIMAAVTGILSQSASLDRGTSRLTAAHARVDALTQTMGRDLRNLFVDEAAPNPFADPLEEQEFLLRFRTTNRLNVTDLGMSQRWPVEVTYRLVARENEPHSMYLLREERDLAERPSKPPHIIAVARGLRSFHVELVDDVRNSQRSTAGATQGTLPLAVVIQAAFDAEPEDVIRKTVLLKPDQSSNKGLPNET